jgi:AraC-like DNA-binding protein
MAHKQRPEFLEGLERSCDERLKERIISAPPVPGIERIEARFTGDFFEPHRHDTYAIGVTLRGVQTFCYRGRREYSLPGRIIALHPDEIHDGAAATEEGLCYRMLYIEPALVRQAIGDGTASLPFVENPVLNDKKLRTALLAAFGSLHGDTGDLLLTDAVGEVARGLARHARVDKHTIGSVPLTRVHLAREYLCANALRPVRSEELEQVTGIDRFTLSRQFREVFATSPHRFLIMRRLDRARQLITQGLPLAEIAAAAGFADQSHLTRHFKKCFGVTPGRWAQATI